MKQAFRITRPTTFIRHHWTGWLITGLTLAVFGGLFYWQRDFMTNIDERDHFAAGYLMSQGRILYRDVFTHHFPFPFYWTAWMTDFDSSSWSRVVSLFRLQLLLFYCLNIVAVMGVSRCQKTKILFGLATIGAGLIMPIYHGNLNLSDVYGGIAMMTVWWCYWPVILGWENSRGLMRHFIAFAAGTAAFWTQPLYLPLLLIPFLFISQHPKRWIGVAGVMNLLPIAGIISQGSWADFWEQAVWFNFAVYAPQWATEGIANYSFLRHTPLYFAINQFSYWKNWFLQPDSPLLIGQLLFALGSWLIAGKLIWEKKWKGLVVWSVLTAAAHIREVKIITGIPFNFAHYPAVIMGIASWGVLLAGGKKWRLGRYGALVGLIVVCWLPDWPVIKQSANQGYNYHVFWSTRQEQGQLLARLSNPTERILVYPHDIDLYVFARRQPIDRFLYWYPWTNAVVKYREERRLALANNPPPVIYLGDLAYGANDHYYAGFFPELIKGYYRVIDGSRKTDIWIRSDLTDRLSGELTAGERGGLLTGKSPENGR